MGAHDALFKHVFSVPEHAAAELAYVLPPQVARRIEWSSLRLEPGSFVDAELAGQHTDLLFSARLGAAQVYLYLLFEHQSSPDRWMPLRMAAYVVRVLEAVRARAPRDRLPIVIPVVLHHGAGGWRTPRSLRELYEADVDLFEALGERALHLHIDVDDLASHSASAIAARRMPALVRVVLGVLRDARRHDLDVLIQRWGPLMIEAVRAIGLETLSAVLHYLLIVRKVEDPALLLAAAREHGGPELEEIAMSAFDRVKAEGRAEGKAEGRAEGKAEGRAEGKAEGRAEGKVELVLRMLRLRFGELPSALVEHVAAASPDALDAMADRILTAKTPQDVIA